MKTIDIANGLKIEYDKTFGDTYGRIIRYKESDLLEEERDFIKCSKLLIDKINALCTMDKIGDTEHYEIQKMFNKLDQLKNKM
jgi:hypothetical protein